MLKKQTLLSLILLVAFAVGTVAASTGRKVLLRVPPEYPALARQLHLVGSVRLEATVNSNGKVKEVKVLGGHPLLVTPAVRSAKSWQYETAENETSEEITINFKE